MRHHAGRLVPGSLRAHLATVDDHLWNQRDCAQHLSYDEKEFRRLKLSGEIPSLRVGPHSTRFRPEAVKAWRDCRDRGEELDLTKVPVAIANDKLLTVPGCAAYLRCSKKTILTDKEPAAELGPSASPRPSPNVRCMLSFSGTDAGQGEREWNDPLRR